MRSEGFPDAEHVSRSLGMTPRTLRNRLMRYGTSFHPIFGDIRLQLAISYLQTSILPNDHIANILAYDDASNFRRAFKRWHGYHPSMSLANLWSGSSPHISNWSHWRGYTASSY